MERKNVFLKEIKHEEFEWERSLGNIKEGRGNLGEEMPVLVYRLMQFTMLDVLSRSVGLDQANEYFRKAGFLAGSEFAKRTLDLKVDFDIFIADLQRVLEQFKIGILRMEFFNPETGEIVVTVGEDLDCSGLPITHDNVCIYDEGFIAGVLEQYTGTKYDVREVDCWASGERICRFNGKPIA
ncbi:MAG: 4-vinyl reductase [Defluviitaleaceae bacterium]|nr:4-vinyl reductase [Defluviitaleaceae bacterium]